MPQGGFTPPEDFKYPGPHGTRSVSWGDWRMPSDAVAALWMEELESLHYGERFAAPAASFFLDAQKETKEAPGGRLR